jgi:hypothetical protein
MFISGFLLAFVISQLWGAPAVYQFINGSRDESKRRLRYWFLLVVSVLVYIALMVPLYWFTGNFSKLFTVILIPAELYGVLIFYMVAYAVAYVGDKLLVDRFKVLKRRSSVWYGLGIVWAILSNVGMTCSFVIFLPGSKLDVPSER